MGGSARRNLPIESVTSARNQQKLIFVTGGGDSFKGIYKVGRKSPDVILRAGTEISVETLEFIASSKILTVKSRTLM